MSKKKYAFSSEETNGGATLASPKHERALQEFKSRLATQLRPHQNNHYLLKWLKARSFDVGKAEQMFKDSMAYREKMCVDQIPESYQPPKVDSVDIEHMQLEMFNISTDFPSSLKICIMDGISWMDYVVLREYLTGGFCGHDKEGSPIRVELFGLLDMKGIMHSCRQVDLEKTKLLQCETTVRDWQRLTEQLGRPVDGLTVIFDMEHVGTKSLWRPGLQMYLHLVKILEDNYPEMMKRMFVIHAPRIFPLLWKICRPLISEDMKNKIHVLGGDYKKVLLEYIDPSDLPAYLGGDKTDNNDDPRCAEMICQGGEVPRSFYLSEGADLESMDSTTIAKGDIFKVPISVNKIGSVLRWEFMTDDYDIAFGVIRRDSDGETVVLPTERIDCHMIPAEGHLICQHTGEYEARFDNSFSWTRSKKLHYTVELHASDREADKDVDIACGGSWTELLVDDHVTTKL